ncbi:MAG: hypothetical protein IKD44_09560 [Lentisphaeria bacterium]|nr:hypothetical protein [Lentisphaeria bacterium]
MQKIIYLFSLFLILWGGTGCALMQKPDYSVPTFYDLSALKVPEAISAPVEFRAFSDVSGNGVGLFSRSAEGTVESDDLNRFTAPPVQLIRRRLIELFPPVPVNNPLKVSGTLCRFEISKPRKSALMVMDYKFSCYGMSKAVRHRIEVKLKGNSGVQKAEALESCVISSARRLAGEVSKFRKECDRKRERK